MKKIISLLAVAVLVSSCGNQMTLLKRHYTKGYYVQGHAHAEKTKRSVSHKPDEPVLLQPVQASLTHQPVAPVLTAALKKAPDGMINTVTGSVAEKLDAAVAGTCHKVESMHLKKHAAALSERYARTGGDANIILLVILSLFPILALVAMYLHDGNQVTANFWVDLVLHLTIIGYAIFALLVVFDIVNLA